jgi:hypothetical protein
MTMMAIRELHSSKRDPNPHLNFDQADILAGKNVHYLLSGEAILTSARSAAA